MGLLRQGQWYATVLQQGHTEYEFHKGVVVATSSERKENGAVRTLEGNGEVDMGYQLRNVLAGEL